MQNRAQSDGAIWLAVAALNLVQAQSSSAGQHVALDHQDFGTAVQHGRLPTRLAELPRGTQPTNVQIFGQRWREDLVAEAMVVIEACIDRMCERLWDRVT